MSASELKAEDPRKVHDGYKEAMVDAILNLLTARLSGRGAFGRLVYGTKPRNAFTTGFLLPKPPQERTGDEEASPIHISAHGLDFQIAAGNEDTEITVAPRACAYVRIYPSAAEVGPGGVCQPVFPVTSDVRRRLKHRVRELLAELEQKLGGREKARQNPDWRKLSMEARRAAHQEIGLTLGAQIEDRDADAGTTAVEDSTDIAPDDVTED